MNADPKAHWERVYRTTLATAVSWYQPEARMSLELIRRAAPDLDTPIIDAGGGASTLVDGLLENGYRDVTVLDVAGEALLVAQSRLGDRAGLVRWLEADALRAELPASHFGVWHDRAVFHFLTRAEDRARYVAQARHALRSAGHIVAASFAPEGPRRCSGLDVVRYDCDALHSEFGHDLRLLDSVRESHTTPSGNVQAFVYCRYRVDSGPGASESALRPGYGSAPRAGRNSASP